MASRDRHGRRPIDRDPIAAAYMAGRIDAAERFNDLHDNPPAVSPGLMEAGPSRRGSRFDENDYRSLPRRPAAYQSRGIRRASTLPVRFEDDVYGLEDVGISPPPVPKRSIPRDYLTRERPARRATVETVDFSDSETAPGRRVERRGERAEPERIIVEEREEPGVMVVVDDLEYAPTSYTITGSELGDAESETKFPQKGKTRIPMRLVNEKALITLRYPFEFEEESGTYVILKALGQDDIGRIREWSDDYNGEQIFTPWKRRVIEVSPQRERIVIEDRSRSRSRSRSRARSIEYHLRSRSHPRTRARSSGSRSPSQRRVWIPSPPPEREYRRDVRYELEELERERERHRLRSQRKRQYDDDDDMDAEQEPYAFTSSRHRKSLLSRDSTVGSLSDISEKDSDPMPQTPSNNSQGKYLCVLRSQYTGEGTIGGFQSATLKVLEDTTPGNRRSAQSVFKWVQFEDASMNLERFEAGTENIVGLTDNQKLAVSRLFTRVRRKFDRPMESPDGSKLRQMAPSILQETVSGNGKSKSGVATWLCLPYFLLQKYSGSLSGLPSSSHPMRSLLQSHSSLAQKGRDMQQAVCMLPGTAPEHCFHIAQVWCLVLDEDLIVTCSRSPMLSLMGKSLGISPESSTPDNSKTRPNRPTTILVQSATLLWSLPLEDCRTWFAFLSHFWEYWPRKVQFSCGGKTITANSWPGIISQTSKLTVRIALEMKPSTKEPRGILSPSPIENSHKQPVTAPAQHETSQDDSITPIPDISKAPEGPVTPSASDNQGAAETPKPPHLGKLSTTDQLGNSFHVFTWLNEVQKTIFSAPSRSLSPHNQDAEFNIEREFTLEEMNLRADLKDMDRFLKRETSFEERIAYDECPEYTWQKVYKTLEDEGGTFAASSRKDRTQAREYEDKVEIFNKAKQLLRFFLPLEFEGRTVGKYWGAIHGLLVALSVQARDKGNNLFTPRYSRELDADEVIQWLSYTARTTQTFRELLSEANRDERSTIDLPEVFQKAWLHLLMAMIFSSKEQHLTFFKDQSTVCSQLLLEGMRDVVEKIGRKSLLEYAVFKPWDVTSLVNFVLFSDVAGQARDTSETYVDYLNHLILGIESRPLDRGHQDKLTAFKQEIRVILKTLQQQRLILIQAERISTACGSSDISVPVIPQDTYLSPQNPSYLEADRHYSRERERTRTSPREHTYGVSFQNRDSVATYASRPKTPGSQIDPTDPSGVQGLLIQDSYALIERKMRLFEELGIRAEELEEENNFKIDYNKDRQDSAIYAFTIVTIIFLPLSTVAGILGMNTNDVRNMEINQWVFWATALPLTVIIITLCLIWAGELENFWKGFSNLWRGKTRGGGGASAYSVLSGRPAAMMDSRDEILRRRSRYADDDYDDNSDLDVRVYRNRVPPRYRTVSRYRPHGRE